MTLELTFWLESPLGKEKKTIDIDSWEFVSGPRRRNNILKVTKPGGEEAELKFRGVENLRFLDGLLARVEGHFDREDLPAIEAFFGSEFPLTRDGIKLLLFPKRSLRRGFIIE